MSTTASRCACGTCWSPCGGLGHRTGKDLRVWTAEHAGTASFHSAHTVVLTAGRQRLDLVVLQFSDIRLPAPMRLAVRVSLSAGDSFLVGGLDLCGFRHLQILVRQQDPERAGRACSEAGAESGAGARRAGRACAGASAGVGRRSAERVNRTAGHDSDRSTRTR